MTHLRKMMLEELERRPPTNEKGKCQIDWRQVWERILAVGH